MPAAALRNDCVRRSECTRKDPVIGPAGSDVGRVIGCIVGGLEGSDVGFLVGCSVGGPEAVM